MDAYLRWLVWAMLFALTAVVLISALKSADPMGLALLLALAMALALRQDRLERALRSATQRRVDGALLPDADR